MFAYYAGWLNAKTGRLADRSGRRDKMLKSGTVPPKTGRMVSLGICGLSYAPPRFGLLLYRRRFVQYGVRNCESAFMQLWKCFIVSPLRSACLAMHHASNYNEDKRSVVATRMQNKVVVE